MLRKMLSSRWWRAWIALAGLSFVAWAIYGAVRFPTEETELNHALFDIQLDVLPKPVGNDDERESLSRNCLTQMEGKNVEWFKLCAQTNREEFQARRENWDRYRATMEERVARDIGGQQALFVAVYFAIWLVAMLLIAGLGLLFNWVRTGPKAAAP